ncbi:dTDP-4-dehydrorhamnose reductase [marine sediment metagenome]|uniref:dTDP-4-dehydrorhamnose reductase n=1 Tax=marine sediment metagenome TaxID=412755 RepID=A0A1B6NTL6_9ZZZZ
MVGRALVSELSKNSNIEIVTASRDQLDLTNQFAVKQFFKSHRVDEVYWRPQKWGE